MIEIVSLTMVEKLATTISFGTRNIHSRRRTVYLGTFRSIVARKRRLSAGIIGEDLICTVSRGIAVAPKLISNGEFAP